jgi:hypothetical protein
MSYHSFVIVESCPSASLTRIIMLIAHSFRACMLSQSYHGDWLLEAVLSTGIFHRQCVYISLNSLAVTSPRYSSSSSYSSPPALSMPTYSKASTTRSTGKPISTNLSTMSLL